MSRAVRYRDIAENLRDRVAAGEFGAGRLLPSEAELSEGYEVSRVTVRRALELLREEGLIDARQGLGWFVATDPLRQTLGRLATIEAQLAESGRRPERRILEFEFTVADAAVRTVLDSEQVLRVRRLNLADDEPFAVVTVWCPAELGNHLSRADVERSPFYELLSVPLGGATQTIAAAAAEADDARLLRIRAGAGLRCRRHSRCRRRWYCSATRFPAHRTEFVVELAQSEPSIAATGLRLL